MSPYIGVQLPDKAGEVVVLEEAWEEAARELIKIPNNEAIHGRAPRDNGVGEGIIHHLIGFGHKRSGMKQRRRGRGGRMGLHRYISILRKPNLAIAILGRWSKSASPVRVIFCTQEKIIYTL